MEFFENCFRKLAISSVDGGQLASQVLQWNTRAPDFNASSNSSRLNLTVWSWLFGQSISKASCSLTNPPAACVFGDVPGFNLSRVLPNILSDLAAAASSTLPATTGYRFWLITILAARSVRGFAAPRQRADSHSVTLLDPAVAALLAECDNSERCIYSHQGASW